MDKGFVQKLQQDLKRSRANLRPGDVGFVKPSINYGSVAGSSAKFFGQGILNLKKGGVSSADNFPFAVSIRSENNGFSLVVSPGTINGIMPDNAEAVMRQGLSVSSRSICIIDCQTDGKVVTRATLKIESSFRPVTPTPNFPPFSFKWPIAFISRPDNKLPPKAIRLVGPSSLVAFAAETTREPVSTETPAQPNYRPYYTWVVSNSTDPIFINIQ